MKYIGEHAWAGQLGHGFALVSFAGALLAALGFFLYTRSDDTNWRTVGRIGYRVHSVAVIGIIVTLFVMLLMHWFEFDYVWKHSNTEMPLRYILSCFWEGQEGSFLLWTFWNVVIGSVLIWRGGSRKSPGWEGPVMSVIALVQVFLTTMLLGVYIFDVRVGSSPFLLIRELPENIGLPWTHLSNYLAKIPQFQNGRGLNPLLQNYWMTIHPPTLFLGFASTVVPFAFAIAGLWKNRLKEWMTPALPWTYFGIMVLGTGVLMGGAWAYEALSFGGFWAWDPVENASLVPWLTLVGTGHLMLINKRKDTSLFTMLLLALGTFLLVLYSTFLTRSGVLGDTSVHSFTGEGMLPGLLIFLLAFIALGTGMLNTDKQLRRYYFALCVIMLAMGVLLKVQVPAIILFGVTSLVFTVIAYSSGGFSKSEEERISSREFWLFIGSMMLMLSALQIITFTSVPVYNLLIEPFKHALASMGNLTHWKWLAHMAEAKYAPPSNPKLTYKTVQVPLAIVIVSLVAIGQYLRYKNTDRSMFFKQIRISLIGAFLLTAIGVFVLEYKLAELPLIGLFFATSFAALANALYIWKGAKGDFAKAGPSVAHVGFALVLLGALISTSRQKDISHYVRGPVLGRVNKDFDDSKDMLIYKGDTLPLGDHFVTFHSKHTEGVNQYFDMDYLAAEPRRFSKGDTVLVRSSLFVAKDDHTASADFLIDQPAHWQPMDSAARRVFWHAKHWSATAPGKREFALDPLVQLNPRFGNVAEPSTKHWPQRDLYTHIRYAKLDPKDSSDFMPPNLIEKNVGDTIITSTCVIVLDSVRTMRDSVTIKHLGPEYFVYVVSLKVRDLYDPTRWFAAKPISIYRLDQPVASKAVDLPQLNTRIDVVSVSGEHIGLNVYEREFVIMQAIVFPGINVLWIGCVLMALGSFLAIRQRVKRGRSATVADLRSQ